MTTIIRRRRLGMSSARGIAERSTTGIRWVRSDKELPQDDLYIRWGCTANVPCNNVLNTAVAIHEVSNKRDFRLKLDTHDLCPSTWGYLSDVPNLTIENKVVFRPEHHAQGRNIFLSTDREELFNLTQRFPRYYISEFIDKQQEFRVCIVQGRVVWVAEKTPADKDSLAWNVNRGGRFDNVRWDNWNLKVVNIAIQAMGISSLDFGGVDIMVDSEGNCTVLEINSAPSLTSPYRQLCMAKAFDYIVNNNKQGIPLIQKLGGYKKFIHPAICDRALVGEK